MVETQELKPQEKMEVATPAEQTKPGPVFTPNVDIFETEKEITLLADVPGVKAEDLGIDLKDNILTLAGEVKPISTPAWRRNIDRIPDRQLLPPILTDRDDRSEQN